MKSLIKIIVFTLLFAGLLNTASAAEERVRKVTNFTTLNPLVVPSQAVEFAIATADLILDLVKRDNVIFRIKGISSLLNANENINSVQIFVYDVTTAGTRQFVATESLSVGVNRRRRVLIPVDLGFFTNTTRKLEVDLYDASRNFVATYPVTIEASNITSQTASLGDPNRQFTCDVNDIPGCVLNTIANRVDFVAKPRRQSSASFAINPVTQRGEINFPFARKFKQFNGNRRRVKVNENNTGTGTTLASFGETLDISRIRLGDDQTDFANFRYDPTGNNFILSSGVNGNTLTDNFYFNDAGKLGIGVAAPPAYLSIRGGTTTMPQALLEAGALTTTPQDGALEFDGTELYFTKGGVRNPIGTGATGAQGPAGPQGPQGIQGIPGVPGAPGAFAGSGTVTGLFDFSPTGVFRQPNGAQDGYVWTSDAAGNAGWEKIPDTTPVAVSAAIDIDGKTSIDVTGLNFVPLTDSNTATLDTLVTMTGGVIGQRVTLQLRDNGLRFDINTAGANRIFWGRGTGVGVRTESQTGIFTFLFDGTAWFLVDRYIL